MLGRSKDQSVVALAMDAQETAAYSPRTRSPKPVIEHVES